MLVSAMVRGDSDCATTARDTAILQARQRYRHSERRSHDVGRLDERLATAQAVREGRRPCRRLALGSTGELNAPRAPVVHLGGYNQCVPSPALRAAARQARRPVKLAWCVLAQRREFAAVDCSVAAPVRHPWTRRRPRSSCTFIPPACRLLDSRQPDDRRPARVRHRHHLPVDPRRRWIRDAGWQAAEVMIAAARWRLEERAAAWVNAPSHSGSAATTIDVAAVRQPASSAVNCIEVDSNLAGFKCPVAADIITRGRQPHGLT